MRYSNTGRRDQLAILTEQMGGDEARARAEIERQERHAQDVAEANARNARIKAAAREREEKAVQATLARWAKAAGPEGDLVATAREGIAALEAELTIARAALGEATHQAQLARRLSERAAAQTTQAAA